MNTTTPIAKQRKPRTRTKRVSSLPPLKLSKLRPTCIDLRNPLTPVVLCGSCSTWVPVTGIQGGMKGAVYKLVPHHQEEAGTAPGLRCRNSLREITWDMTIPEWVTALEKARASREAASRKATPVLPKAFSPRTNQELNSRQVRGIAARQAEWASVRKDVADTDAARRIVPAGASPAEGPEVPLDTLRPRANRPARATTDHGRRLHHKAGV
ncbi:hypothetical protein [Streptomyces sp. NPDC088847]|uniref:hypothetical protein n=1 Tax=Streptomyces sp. NPDC088847 TaxID=3365909 RepID=UPI003816AE88